jgi:two-component system OmpR family response regulator
MERAWPLASRCGSFRRLVWYLVRILVVEDEIPMADSLRRGLEAEGFAVDLAHNGIDGLHLAREFPYDAIVLDLMLPGMNGFLVCRMLREEEIWTPILMLTAKQGDLDEAEGLDTGADDYLTKPFSFPVLIARLRALLRRAQSTEPVTFQAGDLTLNSALRRVFRGEAEIDLTAREFSVLECFMRSVGQVLAKSEIVEKVWDLYFDGDLNIVEVYVRSLRKKIDEPFGRHAIETVRGAGYRLNENGG